MKLFKIFVIAFLFTSMATLLFSNMQKCVSGNCKNGFGKMELEQGIFYKGHFKNGRPEGKGHYYGSNEKKSMDMKSTDGKTFQGYVEDKEKKWKLTGSLDEESSISQGSLIKDEEGLTCTYKGKFDKKVRIFGKGSMQCEDSSSYHGYFKKGIFDGYGEHKFSFEDADLAAYVTRTYIGDFKKGRRHGQGSLYDQNGKIIYKGRWIENLRYKEISSFSVVVKNMEQPERWLGAAFSGEFALQEFIAEMNGDWIYHNHKNEYVNLFLGKGQKLIKAKGGGLQCILIFDRDQSGSIRKNVQIKIKAVILGAIKNEGNAQKYTPVIKIVEIN